MVGGLLIALIILVARRYNVTLFKFDITLRDPLMIAFFTTIGPPIAGFHSPNIKAGPCPILRGDPAGHG